MHALLAHARLMADYNQWINTRLYAAAAELPHDMLTQDRGAFFQILGPAGAGAAFGYGVHGECIGDGELAGYYTQEFIYAA